MRLLTALALCCLAVLPMGVLGKVYIIENRVNTSGNGSADGNNYVTNMTFNDTTQVLTLSRSGLSALSVALNITGSSGSNGLNGTGINTIYVLANGSLQINLTDGRNITSGNLTGPIGATGATGPTGPAGNNGTNGLNGSNASVTSGDSYINITGGVVRANTSAFDATYYPRHTNPQGFYNRSTLPPTNKSSIQNLGTLSFNWTDAEISDTLTASDTVCTDCLGTTEIADSYLLNTGDTSTGDLYVDVTGSTFDAPRIFGGSNFAANNAMRWNFGDGFNSIGTGAGTRMLFQSYWGMEIWGGRQNISALRNFTMGAAGDPALSVYSINNNPALYVDRIFRLAPTDSPTTCNAGAEGALYYDDSLAELCDCNGASWAQVDGGGAC